MPGKLGWPQTKSIMMFGCNDHTFGASLFGNAAPLIAIHRRWIKQILCFCSMPPLQIRKRIGTKMEEKVELRIMPFQLRLGRFWKHWALSKSQIYGAEKQNGMS
jgi:hypothetical protein